MDCRRAEKEICAWVEGGLPAERAAELVAHLELCPACRREAGLWRAVREALRELPVPAPPDGFAAGVMARIRAEEAARRARTGWRRSLALSMRRTVAAAAAAVLLLAGAGSYAARHWWPSGTPPHVAVNAGQNTPGSTIPEGAPTPDAGKPPGEQFATGGTGGGREPNAGAAPRTGAGQVAERPAGSPPGSAATPAAPQGGGGSAGKAPLVFLNRARAIQSTLLKVQVADPAAAGSALLALGGLYEHQEFGRQQLDGKTVVIWRFVVPAEKAEEFIGAAGRLGRVIARQDQSTDITAQFAQALERYHSLLAQAAAGGESNPSLEAEISFLEQQLRSWDKEAGQHVVVVLLEGKQQ